MRIRFKRLNRNTLQTVIRTKVLAYLLLHCNNNKVQIRRFSIVIINANSGKVISLVSWGFASWVPHLGQILESPVLTLSTLPISHEKFAATAIFITVW